MTKQHETASETPIDLRMLWDTNGSSLEIAEKTYRTWLASAGRIQNETIGFLNGSFEKSVAAARELSACKTPTEYFEVQARYADRTMADWIAQSQKIVQLFGEMTMSASQEAAKPGAEAGSRRGARSAH